MIAKERGDKEWPSPSMLMLMQFSSDNCISVNTNVDRHETSGDEVGNTLLVETGGIVVRAYLIIIGDN